MADFHRVRVAPDAEALNLVVTQVGCWIRQTTTRGLAVLFHIEQVHSPENCPYSATGDPHLPFHDPNVSEVTLVAMYGAFMEHTIYLIVRADDFEQLNRFLLPGMKVCTTKITPVGERPLPRWGS